jgi:hypothetical protein
MATTIAIGAMMAMGLTAAEAALAAAAGPRQPQRALGWGPVRGAGAGGSAQGRRSRSGRRALAAPAVAGAERGRQCWGWRRPGWPPRLSGIPAHRSPQAAAIAPATAAPASSALPATGLTGPATAAEIGSGAEAISQGGALSTGMMSPSMAPSAGVAPTPPPNSTMGALKEFFVPKGGMTTQDYMKLGQMSGSMMGGGGGGGSRPQAPAAPLTPPNQPSLTATSPQALQGFSLAPRGRSGGGGLDPRTLQILARLMGR